MGQDQNLRFSFLKISEEKHMGLDLAHCNVSECVLEPGKPRSSPSSAFY